MWMSIDLKKRNPYKVILMFLCSTIFMPQLFYLCLVETFFARNHRKINNRCKLRQYRHINLWWKIVCDRSKKFGVDNGVINFSSLLSCYFNWSLLSWHAPIVVSSNEQKVTVFEINYFTYLTTENFIWYSLIHFHELSN